MFYGDDENKRRKAVTRLIDFYKYSFDIKEECPIFPEHVHIEPTNACNLRCVHCHHSTAGVHFTKKIGMMDLNIYKKVIEEIKGFASRITLNQQGEPLLHPDILEMVAYAKQAGLAVSVLTNATRLTPHIAEQLINSNLDRIVFSFEGSNAKVHESIRRGSNFNKTLKNILYFIKRNYENGHKTFICMSMVDSSYSHDDVESYKRYFNALPIDTIFVNPLLAMSGASLTSYEVDMSSYSAVPKENVPICRLPWESIVVNWDGTVSPCAVDFNESHIVGDVNNQSLLEIFNGAGMQRFRRCHIEKNYELIEEQGPLCESCNCRFNDEYDLRNLKDYVINYLLRQMSGAGKPVSQLDTSSENVKYEHLLKELSKVECLCDRDCE